MFSCYNKHSWNKRSISTKAASPITFPLSKHLHSTAAFALYPTAALGLFRFTSLLPQIISIWTPERDNFYASGSQTWGTYLYQWKAQAIKSNNTCCEIWASSIAKCSLSHAICLTSLADDVWGKRERLSLYSRDFFYEFSSVVFLKLICQRRIDWFYLNLVP